MQDIRQEWFIVDENGKTWYTLKGAAEACGCSRQNVHAWIKREHFSNESLMKLGKLILVEGSALLQVMHKVNQSGTRPKNLHGGRPKVTDTES